MSMIDERTIQLLNADIDADINGGLEPSEREELEKILDQSAEARAMRAELLRLNNLLDGLPEQEPPAGLSREILNKIKLPGEKASFSLSRLFASFQPAATGLAFAAGLLLTVGYYELSPNHGAPSDTASMVGTMVAGQTGGMNLLENNLQFSGDDFSGTVSLIENDGLYVLNFELDSVDQKQVKVGLASTGLSFGGFAETPGDSNDVVDTVMITGGVVRVVSQGRKQFTVFLRENSPEQAVAAELITIDFSNDDGRLDSGGSGS
jgi:hypothetical protein